MELNTVQLLEPLVTELTREVVVGLWSVLLHVPVQGRSLSTLVATDFTPDGGMKRMKRRSEHHTDDSETCLFNTFVSTFVPDRCERSQLSTYDLTARGAF